VLPHQIGVFVRSTARLDRAEAAVKSAGLRGSNRAASPPGVTAADRDIRKIGKDVVRFRTIR
jgi:hypothetical protein